MRVSILAILAAAVTLVSGFGPKISTTQKQNSGTWITYTTGDGLVNNEVNAIAMDQDGHKWFGTSGGVSEFDGASWISYTTSNSGLAGDYVQAVAVDAHGYLWFGTYHGASKFDGTNWTTYNSGNSGLPDDNVKVIQVDTVGNIWFGTYSGGAARFNGSAWTVCNPENSGLLGHRVEDIAFDGSGRVWFSTLEPLSARSDRAQALSAEPKGVQVFDGANWTAYNTYSGLVSDWVWDIAYDPTNLHMWFATWGGVSEFDGTSWTNYRTTNSGLANSYVYRMAVEPDGRKWFGYGWGEAGVTEFDDVNWPTYTTSNSGLAHNWVSAVFEDNGEIWFGTSGGVSKYSPEPEPWTLMFYFAADNDLEGQLSDYRKSINLARGNRSVNIVTFWDTLAGPAEYVVFRPQRKLAKGELNTGLPQTLTAFVSWARQDYPATHYALVIFDHGHGLKGVAQDCSGDKQCTVTNGLDIKEVREALETVPGAPKLDVLYMDACLMGSFEAGYELRDRADYYVAHESIAWRARYVDWYISAITPGTTASALALQMAYDYMWENTPPYSLPGLAPSTVSVTNLAEATNVAEKVSALGARLEYLLETDPNSTITLEGIRQDVQHFEENKDGEIDPEEDRLIDLYHFASLVQSRYDDAAARAAAAALIAALDSYVLWEEHWNGWYTLTVPPHYWSHDDSHGVSIAYPPPATKECYYNGYELQFAEGAEWLCDKAGAQGVRAASSAIGWGPMLVEYIHQLNPSAPDNWTPPDLVPLISRPRIIYLPEVLRAYNPGVPPPQQNHLPYRPSAPSPSDGSSEQSLDLDLDWTGGDPDGDSTTYDVYLKSGYGTPDVLVCDDRATMTCDPGQLDPGLHYVWYVVATDEHGELAEGPVWSFSTMAEAPHAGLIAFESTRDSNGEIYVMNADGTGQRNLTQHAGRDYYPAWSPDGQLIAFSTDRDGNAEVYAASADGSNAHNLSQRLWIDELPSWSPDGTLIAFQTYLGPGNGDWEVFVMGADGTGLYNLTQNAAWDGYPSWSPDGSSIAFHSSRDGNLDVYVMNADGTNPRNLTQNPASDGNPAWSPDGQSIAFVSNRDGNPEIYVVNADGTNLRRLTYNPADECCAPAWSPDSRSIVFGSNRDGNWEIYVMNADGTGVVRLTNDPADDWFPVWMP